ncbi:TniQ family protein [Streptomyces sp. NPDC058122]|uniref:TniQ family protein n=1 Tax=Streptomyces sp. NPDC058122 TaxID=3346349 RepID=UPI0036EB60FB
MTSVVRTLPIRLVPLPGEALDSWLAALAHRSAVDLRGILTAAGPSLSSSSGLAPDYTTYLADEEAERLSWATGVPARRLHAMTLRQYDGLALALMAQRRLVQRFTLWGRSIGSRSCPQCLAEQDGRWPLRWRLTWSMACTRHRVLLAHTCATCGARPHSRSSLASRIHPRNCSARKPSGGSDLGASGVFCGADLIEAAVLALTPDSPVLAAQEWIDDLLTQAEGEAAGNRLRSVFGDLAVVASRVLLRAEPGDFQLYGQKIDQARVAYGNDWRYAPVDAAVLAGPLTRAVEIVRDYSSDASLTTARMLADRDAAATNKPTIDRVRGRTRIGSSGLEGLF